MSLLDSFIPGYFSTSILKVVNHCFVIVGVHKDGFLNSEYGPGGYFYY